MKTAQTIGFLVLIAALGAAGAWVLRSRHAGVDQPTQSSSSIGQEQTFTVRGRVVSLNESSGIIKIAHEEIPDYMPAMTMPFLARDNKSLRGLKPGDDVTFKLAVTIDDSWIFDIQKTGNTALAVESQETKASEENRLIAGEQVPPFTFVDHNGKQRSVSEFSGKFVALTFIYTRCPLPNFCPLLNKKFSELNERLEKEFPGQFHLVSVTIDPTYDTPEVLKRYAEIYGANGKAWTFATGTPEEISTIAELFGLTFNEQSPGLIDHDMRTALIGPDGRVVHIWKSNFWTPYEIRNRIAEEAAKVGRSH